MRKKTKPVNDESNDKLAPSDVGWHPLKFHWSTIGTGDLFDEIKQMSSSEVNSMNQFQVES